MLPKITPESHLLVPGLLALGLMSATIAAHAQDKAPTGPFGGNITGSVAGVSDYVFRGTSQSAQHPAVQGSLEYALPTALGPEVYAGIWGSSVDFTDATIEADLTAGVRGVVGNLGWDLNAIYYAYPGAAGSRDYNFWEVGGALKYDFGIATPRIGLRYSPGFFGGSGSAWYGYAGVDVPVKLLPVDLKLAGQIGHQTVDRNDRFGYPDYTDWWIGVGVSAFTLDFMLQYVDTSISDAACPKLCDQHIVFSVTRAF